MSKRKPEETTECFVTHPKTAQAARWIAYWAATNTNRFCILQLTRGKPVTTPSEWPPPLPDEQPGLFDAGGAS